MSPWYKTGSDGLADDISNSQRRDIIKRFWVPKGESKTILFLDDAAFRFWEHGVKMDGSWRNFFVCLKKNLGEECPLCLADYQPYFVGFYTVIDKTGFTDRSGNKHCNEKLLLQAKTQILEKLKRHSDKRGGLTGCIFDVTRGSGTKSSSVGDDFDFMERLDLTKEVPADLKGIDLAPFNYADIFKPENASDLKIMIAKAKAADFEADSVAY